MVATFVRTYNLNVTSNPSGGGTLTGAGAYVSGSVVPVTATANPGWQFVNWTGAVANANSALHDGNRHREHHGYGQLHPALHDERNGDPRRTAARLPVRGPTPPAALPR